MFMYSFWLICLFTLSYSKIVLISKRDTVMDFALITPFVCSMLGVGAFMQILLFLFTYLFFTIFVFIIDIISNNKN